MVNWLEIRTDKADLLPGSLVKDHTGMVYLVGDVNELLGRCDCCKTVFTHYSNDLVDKIAYLICENIEV